MADLYLCRKCRKTPSATKNNRYRSHVADGGEPCGNSSVEIPPDLLAQGPIDKDAPKDVPVEGHDFATCPECGKKVKLTNLGYFPNHNSTLYGGERCGKSGTRFRPLRRVQTVVEDLPEKPIPASEVEAILGQPLMAGDPAIVASEAEGDRLIAAAELALSAGSSASMETNSPESPTTSTPSPEPSDLPADPYWSGMPHSELFFMETVHAVLMGAFGPPEDRPPTLDGLLFEAVVKAAEKGLPPPPMGDLAKTLATQIKETFYAYSNRKTKDNRSAQTTLGPSEIGTPCDRRLAMALMNIAPVNPGGDGWAAFVGTCTHVGMAEVYTFADAGTGRYAVELPVFLGMPSVPRGTTDLLDRRDGTVVDWKVMGWSSLKKFKAEGPSETYRIQAHVYGLGAERSGEKIRNVAIVGLPRGGFSLDEMHVWTEKYDRKFAQAALDRVEKIANSIQEIRRVDGLGSTPSAMATAQTFETARDCTYCPFHLKGDKEMVRGCPGK